MSNNVLKLDANAIVKASDFEEKLFGGFGLRKPEVFDLDDSLQIYGMSPWMKKSGRILVADVPLGSFAVACYNNKGEFGLWKARDTAEFTTFGDFWRAMSFNSVYDMGCTVLDNTNEGSENAYRICKALNRLGVLPDMMEFENREEGADFRFGVRNLTNGLFANRDKDDLVRVVGCLKSTGEVQVHDCSPFLLESPSYY